MDSTPNRDTEISLPVDNGTSQKRPRHEQPAVPTISKTDMPSPAPSHIVSASPSDPDQGTHAAVMERLIDSKNHVKVNGITFICLKEIGSGATSKVFRVLGPDMQTYALKRVKLKKMDAASVTSYLNEINVLKSLQGSSHIIKLLADEMDDTQKLLYLVTEVGEISLVNKLKELKEMKIVMEKNFLGMVWHQMLLAVNDMHTKGIFHGNLKPANFLFVNGAIKLRDLGIAKAISKNLSNGILEQADGTANYISPEVAASLLGQSETPQEVGRAGDIWSLGCILCLMVHGVAPFGVEANIFQKLMKIADPSHTINFPPLEDQQLADVIQSCLRYDPKLRPAMEGPSGLLEHPFVHPRRVSEPNRLGASSGSSEEPPTEASLSQVLQQVKVLVDRDNIYSQALEKDALKMMKSITDAKKARRAADHAYLRGAISRS